jgi:hypothetical protein
MKGRAGASRADACLCTKSLAYAALGRPAPAS